MFVITLLMDGIVKVIRVQQVMIATTTSASTRCVQSLQLNVLIKHMDTIVMATIAPLIKTAIAISVQAPRLDNAFHTLISVQMLYQASIAMETLAISQLIVGHTSVITQLIHVKISPQDVLTVPRDGIALERPVLTTMTVGLISAALTRHAQISQALAVIQL